jgi:hypothetical protein
MKRAITLLLFGAIPLALPATGRAQSDDDAPAGAGESRYTPARFKDTNRIQIRYEWNLKSTLGAYETSGIRNPKWDADAKECLTAVARIRSLPSRTPADVYESCSRAASRASKAGCTDPLVHYLYLRYGNPDANDARTYTLLLQEAADELDASDYPPIRKFWAHRRAAEYTPPPSTNAIPTPPKIMFHRLAALTNLVRATRDITTPIEEIYAAADSLFNEVERNFALHARLWRAIEPTLIKNWPNEYLTYLLKGKYYSTYAWHGRGNSLADKVPEENWKLFRERLEISREALRQAWTLDTQDERIPLAMISSCKDLGDPRAEMELWFDRAMTLKPDYYAACLRKSNYLEPRWHGSMEELLAFGRRCVTNRQWSGSVPLALVGIHSNLYLYTPRAQRVDYWKNPAVWPDLKSSFDTYLKLHPDDNNQRGGYIRHAALCGRWDTVREQLPLLTRTNYSSFGGQAEFQRIVREAADKTRQSVP